MFWATRHKGVYRALKTSSLSGWDAAAPAALLEWSRIMECQRRGSQGSSWTPCRLTPLQADGVSTQGQQRGESAQQARSPHPGSRQAEGGGRPTARDSSEGKESLQLWSSWRRWRPSLLLTN